MTIEHDYENPVVNDKANHKQSFQHSIFDKE